jgi:hypothetical protein
VVLPDGSIVVMGGGDRNGYRNDVWRSEDRGATWTQMTASAGWQTRKGQVTVAMPDGSIILMGGESRLSYATWVDNEVWRSDDKGATWTHVTNAGWAARVTFTGVVIPDGSIVIMGGYLKYEGYADDVWRSADKGATWAQANSNNRWPARSHFSSVVLPDGSIVIMGGYNGTADRNDVWRSEFQGATWSRMTDTAGWSAREDHSSVTLPDGSIVLMGGGDSKTEKNDVWRSVDKGKTWTQMTGSAGWSAREGQSSVLLPDGSIVLMGGGNGWRTVLKDDVWRSEDYGVTWTCVNTSAGWSARADHSSVVLPDGSIVLMGGVDTTNVKNDVWRSEDKGATWTEMTGNAAWSARAYQSSVCEPDGSIVLMGGSTGTNKKDVWRSEDYGATWTCVNASAGWSGRVGQSSLVLPDGRIILMGGYDDGYKNDVWSFFTAGSSVQHPSHSYTEDGNYSVALQVYNLEGYSSEQKERYINITGYIPPPEPNSPDPVVSSVTPKNVCRNCRTTITLAGNYFRAGATAYLNRTGSMPIPVMNITVVNATRIVGDLILPGGPIVGNWSVVVTTPQGGFGVKKNAISIKPWRDPHVKPIKPKNP